MNRSVRTYRANEEARARKIKNTKRAVIISASVILSLVLSLGGVLGITALVKDKNAVVKYGGVTVDRGVASYLAATYKTYYKSTLPGAQDTEEYWGERVGEKTRGELLGESTEEYIRSVVVGAYLFDRYASLSSAERAAIEQATEEVLLDRTGGDTDKFNEKTAPYGFDYDDFCLATELIYKAEGAKSAIYGNGGAALTNVADATVLSQCNLYFEQYSRVKILYIDTKETVVKDSEGKLEIDGGKYTTRYLTAAEIVARRGDIEEIRRLIEGAKTGEGDEMSPEYFDLMQDKYNITKAYNESGYYFSESSAFSEGFAEDTAEYLSGEYAAALYKMLTAATESALTMNEGEYHEIEGDFGICFIYKCKKEEGAFLSPSYGAFFHDFFSDAADYLYNKSAEALFDGVEVREKYQEIDPVKIPYNYEYIAKIAR